MSTVDRLILLSGSLKGRETPINGIVTIGRSPKSTIQLDDLKVSRKHAQVILKDDGVHLIDLGSGNGTFVGLKRIVEHHLKSGDIFRMGRHQIQFRAKIRPISEPINTDFDPKMEDVSDVAAKSPWDEIPEETPEPPPSVAAKSPWDEIPEETPESPPAVAAKSPWNEIPEETPEPPPAAVRQDAPEKTPVKRIEPSPEPSPSIDIDQDTHGKTPIKAPTANAGEQMKSHAPEELVKTFFGTPPVTCTSTELKDIQKRLAAVYAANQTIASEQSLTKVFENIMSEVFSLVKAHNGLIMLKQEDVKELAVEYARPSKDGNEIHVSSTIINRVFDQGEAIITNNASQDARFNGGMSIIKAEISSAMCVPLTHQGEKLGVIYVDNRGTTNAFEDSDLEMLVAVAAPAATAIKNARYLGMIEDAYDDTLKALANAIELRDHYTVGHTLRVTNFAVKMARELKWDEEKISEVKRGGVLHDIGKIAVDNAILGKPGKLTEEEFAQMQVHPDRGADLLREVKFLHPLISYCLCHHEKWDGSGYPCGLKGEDIPIEGRIIAVADAFDAMTSTRPYRKGMAPDIAIERLKEGKEKQFDATMVDALEKCFESGKIDRILQDYYKNEARSIACPFCSTFIRLDDNTDNSSEIECSVCHKNVRVIKKEETYFGVLATKR